MTDFFKLVFEAVQADTSSAIIAAVIVLTMLVPVLVTIYRVIKIVVEKVN